jgi:hypothetical protein
MYLISYQRLRDSAAELDIDHVNNCINFVSVTNRLTISLEGSSLLEDLLIQIPKSLYGIFTVRLPGVIIDNNFIPPGFYGNFDHIKFYSTGSCCQELLAGQIFGSLFLLPTKISHLDLEVQEVNLKENDKMKVNEDNLESNIRLVTKDGSKYQQSRLDSIKQDIKLKNDEITNQKIKAIKDKIRNQIKLNVDRTYIKHLITTQIYDDCVNFIYNEHLYDEDDLTRFGHPTYKYTYDIFFFVSSEEATTHMESYKDNSHYYWYKKLLLGDNKRYFLLIVQIMSRNPFD